MQNNSYRFHNNHCNNENYKKYLVIFVDLLGTKNRKNFDEQFHIISIFHEEFEKNQNLDKDYTVYFRKIYTFSDCAYIFYGFKDGVEESKKDIGKLFTTALVNCEPIFLRFLSENIYFRGGVYYGDAYISNNRNMFYGKAVNQAYLLENNAKTPRILVDDYVAKVFQENVDKVTDVISSHDPVSDILYVLGVKNNYPDTGDLLVFKDEDNKYVFNYFHLLYCFPEIFLNNMSVNISLVDQVMSYCESQLNEQHEKNIKEKYEYLKKFCQRTKNEISVADFIKQTLVSRIFE